MLLPLDKIRSQARNLKCYCFYGAQWVRIAQSKRVTMLGATLPKIRNSRLLKHRVSLRKRGDGQSPKKEDCQWSSVVLCSLFWILWPLKMGPICRPATMVRNYHSTMHNVSEERRSHKTIWWRRPWFGSAWSNLARPVSALNTRI